MGKQLKTNKRCMNRHKKIIISGGGTGGHIFPAISIANALKKIDPETEILFVGAEGRMEMEKVPAAGYKIIGLPVAGFYRSLSPKNFKVLAKLMKSLLLARKVIKDFQPDVVVGVGGYASGPVLRQAGRMNIPTLIQEQNSYAGVTNKLLAKHASVICTAYEDMGKYFPSDKIIITGNPVRQSYENIASLKNEAFGFFKLKGDKPVVLVLGGSLGAGSINNSLSSNIEKMENSGVQWLWQTGKYYYENVKALVSVSHSEDLKVHDFINRMDLAYAAADIIVSRAGAGTISELCLVGKPVILIPSPNVAEDHQTKNARALSDRNAAVFIADKDAASLVDEAVKLITDTLRREELSRNIALLAKKDADIRIAEEVIKLAGK